MIFIVDNSGSIDDFEFSTMQNSIDQLSTQILANNPTTRIAVVQYGGIDLSTSPGLYDISIPFSSNVATLTSWNRVFSLVSNIYNDYLPASMSSMRLDGIWDAGGELDLVSSPCKPVFILFTDAYGNSEDLGSTLFNAGGQPGLTGYGEYNILKVDYNAKFIVYHVINDDPFVAPLVGSAISSVGGDYMGPIDPNPGDPEGSQTIPRNYLTGSFQFNQVTVDDILFSMANTQSSFEYSDNCTGNVDFQSTSTSSQSIINWQWDFGDGSAVSTIENPSHLFSPGQYDVSLIVEGDLGCKDTITETIEIINILPNAGTDESICSGDDIQIGSPAIAGQTYNWTPTTGLSNSTSAQPTASPVSTTTYSLTVTGDNGCITEAVTVEINVSATPTISLTALQSICAGDETTIGINPAVGTTYTWSPTTGLSSSSSSQTTASPEVTTTYTLSATSSNGCTSTGQTQVQIYALPIVNAGTDAQLCLGDSIQLVGSGAISYSWDNGAMNQSYILPDIGINTYTITGTDIHGCTSSDQVTISTYSLPNASFTASDYVLSSIDPTVDFTNTSSNAISYSWDFGDELGISTEVSPSYEFDNETFGTLPITLIATSPDGCLDTSIVFILINEENICFVPNAFTPNGDEFNNEFAPIITSGYDYYNYNLLIFNRWGEVIFESKDTEQGWDGSYNGTLVQSGTYTWKISLKSKNNDDRKIVIGNLTVIR